MGEPVWRIGERRFDCSERSLVMGIVNATPDSFSDGGRFGSADDAVRHAVRLAADGADIVDVGGESTRPGSDPVDASVELERVVPVIRGIAAEAPQLVISVDTRKAEVAAAALEAGATLVNDVSAAADPDMFGLVADRGAGLVLMHMLGDPTTMQEAPTYQDVVAEVHEYLRERVESAVFAGVDPEQIAVDPGIGFGKELEHNLALLRRIDALLDLDRPVLVGPSRKRFLGTLLDLPVDQRVEGTAAAVAWVVSRGAHAVRVHDVREIARVLRVIDAIARAGR